MNRKNRCPYCGKRISYGEKFSYRRKAEYVCPRCGKESRVIINKMVILIFVICAVIAALIMTAWIYFDLVSNPLGIVAVAFPLIIFGLMSPNFVRFEPLRKYQKSMEARRAGIAYSDNLSISELDEEVGYVEGSNQFQINNDVFNKIKAERSATTVKTTNSDLVSDSKELENNNINNNEPDLPKQPYVEVMGEVRENHSAADDSPLKKIHSEGTRINRSRHYIDVPEEAQQAPVQDDYSENIKTEKAEPNRFSANRRF